MTVAAATSAHTRLAAISVLAAMAWFGLIDNFIRFMADDFGLWPFQMFRGLVALAVLGIIARVRGVSLRPKRVPNVAARSVIAAFALVIYFACLGIMPISQAVAGLFTSPIWVVIISVLFFGEKIGPRRIFAVLAGFGGTVLALGGAQFEFSLLSILPVLSGLCYAVGNLATRRWCEGETTLAMLTGYSIMVVLWGCAGLLVVTWIGGEVPEGSAGYVMRGLTMPTLAVAAVVFVQGAGTLLGVGLTIRAYQLADATFVSVLENTLLVFATIWAAILWQEFPDGVSVAGLCLIMVSGVIIAVRTDSPPMSRVDKIGE